MDRNGSWVVALDARIEREIHRLRARYELSLDEFRGLYVSDEQVDSLVSGARVPAADDVAAAITRPSARSYENDTRWRNLVDRLGLSTLEQDVLLVVAAPEFDSKYETLYAYLNNDVTRKWATVDLVRRLLSDVASSSMVAATLAAGARLHARHVIERIDAPAGRPGLMNVGSVLQPVVTHWLHEHPLPLAFAGGVVTWERAGAFDDDAAVRERAEPIVRLLARCSRDGRLLPVIALVGQAGSGRMSTAVAVAALSSRPLARLDLRALAESESEAPLALNRLTLALWLTPAVVLIDGLDAWPEDEARPQRIAARIARTIGLWPPDTLVLIRAGEDEPWRALARERRIVDVRCDLTSFAARLDAWRRAAAAHLVPLADADLYGLAGRFSLTAGQIDATLATAQDLAAIADSRCPPAADLVAAAARVTSDQALGKLAVKIESRHQWNDLVLPSVTVRRLRELGAAIRQRHMVYGEWGFGDRITTGIGIKALFAGVSGTGKTMAAGIIARELGLDLYKVDLSGVVSKYIGETEKNLDRIFRAARSANAIIFLDEAEAIMGKRSEVKDAHDRYANIEVAYLLQRLEDHDGVVILATNLKRNIDDAFNRRMQYVIEFPRPEEGERERIWRSMFPARSPLAADVDFPFLAKHFDLAGGDIRNVVLDAAFLAAADGGVIDMRAIVEALVRQLAKQGKTPTGTDFRQYQRLLSAAGRH